MKSVLFLLISVVILHFVANTFGIYDAQIAAGNVWIDNILHAIVGLAIALLWTVISKDQEVSSVQAVIKILAFVAVFAFAWELLEFAFYIFVPNYATKLQIYSPSAQEAFMDIISNLGGGALVIIWKLVRHKSSNFIPDNP